MARNFIQEGDRLTILSTAAVAAGAGVLHGQIVGIAQNACTAAGQDLTLQLTGVVEMPKAAGSFGLGVLLYFDNATGRATTTQATNRPLGFHAGQVANAGAAGTLCQVLLSPSTTVTV